jgi:hypothetical protein
MNIFERYLSVWVLLCIVVGVAAGHFFAPAFAAIGATELAQVNLPIAALVWLMIIPMLMKVDFAALRSVGRHWRGIGVTLFVNWAVKPFTMAALAALFIAHLFRAWLPAAQVDSYIAGLILLAAAPCTAMVFVWSHLTDGEPNFTLSQVALNDTIMIVAFAPIVGLLLGLSAITVPWATLALYRRARHLRPGGAGAGAATGRPRGARQGARGDPAALADGPAGDADPAVRISRSTDHRPTDRHCSPRRADPDPGLFQFRARLSAEQTDGRIPLRRRAVRPDRRQ